MVVYSTLFCTDDITLLLEGKTLIKRKKNLSSQKELGRGRGAGRGGEQGNWMCQSLSLVTQQPPSAVN